MKPSQWPVGGSPGFGLYHQAGHLRELLGLAFMNRMGLLYAYMLQVVSLKIGDRIPDSRR